MLLRPHSRDTCQCRQFQTDDIFHGDCWPCTDWSGEKQGKNLTIPSALNVEILLKINLGSSHGPVQDTSRFSSRIAKLPSALQRDCNFRSVTQISEAMYEKTKQALFNPTAPIWGGWKHAPYDAYELSNEVKSTYACWKMQILGSGFSGGVPMMCRKRQNIIS